MSPGPALEKFNDPRTPPACGPSPGPGCSAFFRTKYRIVKDGYLGYEAQFKRWWFPFWMQCDFCNTSGTVEQARKICDLHSRCGVVEEYQPNKVGFARIINLGAWRRRTRSNDDERA